MPDISIILCTRDRARDLEQTLAALRQVDLPNGLRAELLVVDNGSRDRTADVVGAARLPHIEVRYLLEPRRGKGYAYNAGMAASGGEALLFTDDDVRPPTDWLERMCRPILDGEADAVVGGVVIPPDRLRPWMGQMHRVWLASTEALDPVSPPELIGANMAFSRAALADVPGFDPELGPGALGFGDDTVFTWQLAKRGKRVVGRLDVGVEHHFDPARLSRASFLRMAEARGRTAAYITHHWYHRSVPAPAWRAIKTGVKLRLLRIARRSSLTPEGISEWEANLVQEHYFYRQFLRERRRPRRYDASGRATFPPTEQFTASALADNAPAV